MNCIYVDKDLINADWTKSWDFPYNTEEELKNSMSLADYNHFKTLPVYKNRPWAIK